MTDQTASTETPTAQRRRLIVVKGDSGNYVYRNAHKYNADVAVYAAPAGVKSAEQFEHPGLILKVSPAGDWTLTHRSPGWESSESVTVAAGHIDQAAPVYTDETAAALVASLDGESRAVLLRALRNQLAPAQV